MTVLPSSRCSRAMMPGSTLGGRSESTRAGMSGRATLRTRVRFIADSAGILDAKARGHARTQAAAIAEQFDENFKSSTRRVDHGADLLHAGQVLLAGYVGGSYFELLALVDPAKELLGESKAHFERRLGGDPEEPFAFGHVLPLTYITTGNQAGKRGGDFGFLQFEFERALLFARGVQSLLNALDVPLVGFGLVLGMLQLFLRGQTEIPQMLLALIVRFEYLRLGLPVVEVGLNAAGFRACGFKACVELPVVHVSKDDAGLHPGRCIKKNLVDQPFALRGNLDLMLDNDGPGNDNGGVRGFRWRRRSRGWGGRRRRNRFRIGRSRRLAARIATTDDEQNSPDRE